MEVVGQLPTESGPGIELAYVVSKSDSADVWDFVKMPESLEDDTEIDTESDENRFPSVPPGMCVEGVRVRSVPAGYKTQIFLLGFSLISLGGEAPKTNHARSDVEQTPELDHNLLQIYSMLGKHIQSEFDRLRANR